jgi:hypothetical protein
MACRKAAKAPAPAAAPTRFSRRRSRKRCTGEGPRSEENGQYFFHDVTSGFGFAIPQLAFIGECTLNVSIRMWRFLMRLAAMVSAEIEIMAVTAAFPRLAAGILSKS